MNFIASPIIKYIGIAVLALALIAAIVFGVRSCKQIDSNGDNILINAGADKIQSRQQGEVINALQTAHDAVQHPTSDQLNVVCSRYDRNCPTARRHP